MATLTAFPQFLSFFLYTALFYNASNFVTSQDISQSNCFSSVNDKVTDRLTRDTNPQCVIETTGVQGVDFNCTEITPRSPTFEKQFRIIGEYGVLTIRCLSSYPTNFHYDGFRPTEAVTISYWKEVSVPVVSEEFPSFPNISIDTIGITVSIASIQTLFEQVQNDEDRKKLQVQPRTTPIVYSRTGRYTVRDVDRTNWEWNQSFYFFFEEPLMAGQESFMSNQHTTFLKQISHRDRKYIAPCRPSHYINTTAGGVVSLILKHKALETDVTSYAVFDPTIGFEVGLGTDELKLVLGQSGTVLRCRVKMPGSTRDVYFDYTSDRPATPEIFGTKQLNMTQDTEALYLEFKDFSDASSQFLKLSCGFNTRPTAEAKFLSWGTPLTSYQQLSYSKEFVLPHFANLSYYTQTVVRPQGETFLFDIHHESSYGVIFCTTGNRYKYTQYGTGITGRTFQFALRTDLVACNLPTRPYVPIDTFLLLRLASPKPSEPMFTSTQFEFICRHSPHCLSPPILWFTKSSQGVIKLVHKDSTYKRYNSYAFPSLRISLTSDIVQVSCSMSYHDTTDWITSSINLTITDGSPPKISPTLSTVFTYSFQLNSEHQIIRCFAEGKPPPTVWWERLGKNFSASGSGSSTLELEKVTEDSAGEYICRFQNPYGQGEKSFEVEISSSGGYLYWLIVGLLLLFFFATASIYVYFRMRFNQILSNQEIYEFKNGIPQSNDGAVVMPFNLPYPKEYEIPVGEFTIDDKSILGSGAFGCVMKGFVKDVAVAVKTVKQHADKTSIKALLSEIKILIHLGQSPYLIQLVGASTANLKQGIVYAFVEFCDLGSLLGFLQQHRSQFFASNYSNVQSGGLNVELLITWSSQIAHGLSYLASKKVIHGDLAARNVLLTKDRTVKITDFGLSRQLYNYSLYVKQSEEPLPWRWMSIESLADLTFSIESDVWSYGILLWEIFSLGEVPYPGCSWTIDFVNTLKAGLRMQCPALMNPALFAKLVLPCWAREPKERPSFDEIINIIAPYQLYKNA